MNPALSLTDPRSSSSTITREPEGSGRSLRARKRPLVFLAEDDADLRRVIGESLRDAGFDVLSASTGHDMLKLLTAVSRAEVPVPDAFVMDVRMPRCSGLDVLSALRLAEWQQPVIMITGFGDPSLHAKAASYGASVILDKPVDTEDIVEMLDVLLRLAHAEVMKPTRNHSLSFAESGPPVPSSRHGIPSARQRREAGVRGRNSVDGDARQPVGTSSGGNARAGGDDT